MRNRHTASRLKLRSDRREQAGWGEPLERRVLLSGSIESPAIDSSLSIAFRKSTIPASVITTVNNRGVVLLTITNNGSSLFRASTPITLYASADGTVDDTATAIAIIKHVTVLKPGKSDVAAAVIKALPAALDGTYTLLAQLSDPTTANTVLASGPQVTVTPATINFSEVLVSSKLPVGNGRGKNAGDAKLTITNNGNVISKGRTTIDIYASADNSATGGALLRGVATSLPLKPGASRTLTIPLSAVPPSTDTTVVAVVTDPQGHSSTTGTSQAGTISQYALPSGAEPQQIILGPDGNYYFTVAQGNYIGQITPSGIITDFTIPTPDAGPSGLAVGPDGNIWFAEAAPGVNAIAAVSTAGDFSVMTPIPIPTAESIPTMLTLGPDGNIWFTEQVGNKIGTVRSGAITEYTVPTANSGPFGIVTGSDGNLWFTERDAGQIGKITTGGIITEFSLGNALAAPLGITAGPDGNLWFTEEGAGQIGTITLAGTVTTYPASTSSGSGPYDIVAGAGGVLYFTDSVLGDIGQITTAGQVTDDAIPSGGGSDPEGICAGIDGSIWFVDAAVSSGDASVGVLAAG